MFRFSIILVCIAAVVGGAGLLGVSGLTWNQVSTVFYILLLFPALLLVTVGLRKSFKPGTMIAIRAVIFIVMAYTLLAFMM